MSQRGRRVKILSAMLPAGALGMSIGLAQAAVPAQPATPGPGPDDTANSVANRLQTIRDDVSAAAEHAATGGVTVEQQEDGTRLAWWGNGGWGNGWHNGGWHNWGNGWHNWGNGWHNWGNGWHNW